MTAQIAVALISFAGTLLGSLAGIYATSRLTNYRLEQLEKKVEKHNELIEHIYIIEQHEAVMENNLKSANHRITDLENQYQERIYKV